MTDTDPEHKFTIGQPQKTGDWFPNANTGVDQVKNADPQPLQQCKGNEETENPTRALGLRSAT